MLRVKACKERGSSLDLVEMWYGEYDSFRTASVCREVAEKLIKRKIGYKTISFDLYAKNVKEGG